MILIIWPTNSETGRPQSLEVIGQSNMCAAAGDEKQKNKRSRKLNLSVFGSINTVEQSGGLECEIGS